MVEVRQVHLVSISDYANSYGLSRTTIYDLIDKGILTRYEQNGIPMLNLLEKPVGVQKYAGKRERKIR